MCPTKRYQSVMTQIAAGSCVVLDGGTGAEISRRGASLEAWGALATTEHPELLYEIYKDFIDSGAQVLSTNTFGASALRLEENGIFGREEELNRASVQLAQRVRDEVDRSDSILVAGSMTTVDHRGSGSLSRELRELADLRIGDLEEERTLESQAKVLVDAGADLILLEMLSQVDHCNLQLEAVRKSGAPVWAGFSCKLREDGEVTLLGHDDETFAESLDRIELTGVDIVFVMHSGIDVISPALNALRDTWPGPCGAYPHGGRWRRSTHTPYWEFDPEFLPSALVDAAADWITQ